MTCCTTPRLLPALCTVLAAASLCFHTASAEIISINTIQELEQHATPGTLVLVDIDHTLIRPTVSLGSQEWWKYLNEIVTNCLQSLLDFFDPG